MSSLQAFDHTNIFQHANIQTRLMWPLAISAHVTLVTQIANVIFCFANQSFEDELFLSHYQTGGETL